MKVKEESEKVGLKLSIQKTEIMAPGPITSWQMNRETMETVTDCIYFVVVGGSNITAGGECSHEIKGHLFLGRKSMTNRQHIKKQRHYFVDKCHLIKAMIFLVVMYGCES